MVPQRHTSGFVLYKKTSIPFTLPLALLFIMLLKIVFRNFMFDGLVAPTGDLYVSSYQVATFLRTRIYHHQKIRSIPGIERRNLDSDTLDMKVIRLDVAQKLFEGFGKIFAVNGYVEPTRVRLDYTAGFAKLCVEVGSDGFSKNALEILYKIRDEANFHLKD